MIDKNSNMLRTHSENTFKESEQIKESMSINSGISEMTEKPKPADLIKIHRGLYQHWALYTGDGNVIHLAPTSEHADAGVSSVKSVVHSEATVKKEKLQDVVGNNKYHTHNVLDKQCPPLYTPDILQKAENLVGKVLPYNLETHNCEHFVTGLRYGTPKSQQVRNGFAVVAVIGLILVGFFFCVKLESKVSNCFGFVCFFFAIFICIFHILTMPN
ncbi:HRAS-like suppressor 3 [Carassius auratus]|uniref:HRAS-like suppressor 3 n=1 Tax=Carassius auratus TaxID=7957 RepID=A0A6P6RLJ8_CARAU|nr:HRAS-like suppressor 3 [Carassius auratus]